MGYFVSHEEMSKYVLLSFVYYGMVVMNWEVKQCILQPEDIYGLVMILISTVAKLCTSHV